MLLRAPDTRHWTEVETRSRTVVAAAAVGGIAIVALLLLSLVGSSSRSAVAEAPSDLRTVITAIDRLPQDGITLGRPDAPATLTVYGSLDVPARGIAGALPALIAGPVGDGRLNLELRTLTRDVEGLAPEDGDAALVARSAQAAGLQDRLWPLVAALADGSPGYVDEPLLAEALARVPRLDLSRVRHDARSPRVAAAVARADAKAEEVGAGPDASLVLTRPGHEPLKLARQAPDRLVAAVEKALATP